MLSETDQSQKDKYCMVAVYEVPGVFKFTENKVQQRLPRPGERGEWGTIV